jgi:4-alpha-glucanotransferase
MTADAALADLARAHGILPGYTDMQGQPRPMARDTQLQFLRASGLELDGDRDILAALAAHRATEDGRLCPGEVILTAGRADTLPLSRPAAWRVELETGAAGPEGRATDRIDLPPLPPGVHRLILGPEGALGAALLIVAPPVLPSVAERTGRDRAWGVTCALYGLRSGGNLGVGDYTDLGALARLLGGQGAAFLGINPLHDPGWMADHVISPYSPSHRGFLNTRHLSADCVPGLEGDAEAQGLIARARQMAEPARTATLVDHATARRLLRDLLEALYPIFCDRAAPTFQADFAAFRAERGEPLARYARFEVLSEIHGHDWRDWPEGAETAPAPDRLAFHAWLQWLADRQLAGAADAARGAGMALGLYLDLAVGARRGGAETWCERDAVATGVSIGAPPDHLSPEGQNWQLAAYAPSRLRATGYRAFREILRETLRHAGLLRIDHILGFNRSFWIPDGGGPGGYVRQPFEALLAITAIEAARAGVVVVGEDLGLVPEGFRETLAARGIYGYSVLQYEKDGKGRPRPPGALRRQTLACFGTHDTPTLRGYWTGHDIGLWQSMGWADDATARQARAAREAEKRALLAHAGAANGAGDARQVAGLMHGLLADAPCQMVSVQLDDMLLVEEAQNLPGTVDAHPNWRRKSPSDLVGIAADPVLEDTARIMRGAGRAPRETQSIAEDLE